MNRIMGMVLACLAIVGGALAVWSGPRTPPADLARQELARVTQARDAADKALAAARSEIERASATAATARLEAEHKIAKIRQEAEAAVVAARTEANKAVAAARVEGERQLAVAQAQADKAIAAARAEAEKAAAGDKLAAMRAESERRMATVRSEAEQAIAAARAEADKTIAAARAEGEKAVAALRDQLGECRTAAAKPKGDSARCSTDSPSTGAVDAADIARELTENGSIALYGIQFDVGSAKLTPESRASIDEVAKAMKEDPKLKLLIVGHTDNKGDFTINRNLSEQRAQAVVTDLVTRLGADRNRLSSAGVADLSPVSTNETEAGRARNRRVELVKQ
jgi:outer membrane protein OmpA-like peptidoglycan-associated protein